jgi:hypothetical protein
MVTYEFPIPQSVDLVELTDVLSVQLGISVACSLGESLLVHVERELSPTELAVVEQTVKNHQPTMVAPTQLVSWSELIQALRARGKITERGLVVSNKTVIIKQISGAGGA